MKVKSSYLIVLFLGLSSLSLQAHSADSAQIAPKEGWKVSGVVGLNASETALKNWSLGGENSFTGNVYLLVNATYIKGKHSWGNALNTQYGKAYTEQYKWYKSMDILNITSKYGYAVNPEKTLMLSALADFTTQYDVGYLVPPDSGFVSKWFAPAYLNIGLGVDYRPYKWMSLFYSPLADHMTFVYNDYLASQNLFGIGEGVKFKSMMGMLLSSTIDLEVYKNIMLKSVLDLFTPYDKTFGNIIVNWNLLITAKITSHINFSFNFLLKYDDRVKSVDVDGILRPRVQIKEMMGLGIAYNF